MAEPYRPRPSLLHVFASSLTCVSLPRPYNVARIRYTNSRRAVWSAGGKQSARSESIREWDGAFVVKLDVLGPRVRGEAESSRVRFHEAMIATARWCESIS